MVSLVGMLIPISYISLLIIMGVLVPGYNHMRQLLSILGGIGGFRGDIFNIGVGTTGGLIIIFAIGFNRAVNQSKARLKRVFLFILGGLGLIGAAIMNCNQGCEIDLSQDPIRALHGIFAFIAGISLTFAPLPFYSHFKQDLQWKKLAAFTLTTVILSIIASILFWIMFVTNIFPNILGLIQRIDFLFGLIWIGVSSIVLLLALNRNSIRLN
ncbi:MAG: DUF998 domain-containing protein [Candidatus Hermodarchaeota archaeon]